MPPPPVAEEQTPGADLQLVAAILLRDRKATAEFVSRYADAVYGYVRRRLTPRVDLVDDLVQEVFLAGLGSLPTFRGSSSLRAWLLGIARHKVEEYYREQLRLPDPLGDDEDAAPLVESLPIDETIDRERMRARAQHVLRQLPEPYALALLWRYWEGQGIRAIAEATGKTEKAIERMLARARARFRQLWEQSSR